MEKQSNRFDFIHFRKAVAFGVLIGLLGGLVSVSRPGMRLEEDFGLGFLFRLRGVRPAPEAVVVIALDKQSANHLKLPRNITNWPRSIHAQLVHKLKQAGARVIAFDVFFKEARKNDSRLARAIRDAGNVVLIEAIEKGAPKDQSGRIKRGMIEEKLVPPTGEIAETAAFLAPFPLPKVPVRVNQFWTFKQGTGDLPTLPVAAFQIFALGALDEMAGLFENELNPVKMPPSGQRRLSAALLQQLSEFKTGKIIDRKKLGELIRNMKQVFGHKAFTSEITAALENSLEQYPDQLKALIKMYAGGDSHYLNFYGPPGTITTVPYFQALQILDPSAGDLPALDFNGKAVFIGYSETVPDAERKDDFYTVFSQSTGLDLSGVEISATAFANLLEDRSIQLLPLFPRLLTILFWGVVVGMLWFLLSPAKSMIVTAGSILLFIGLVYSRFNAVGVWFPLIIPLFFQVPMAGFGAVLWRLSEAKRKQQQIEKAVGRYLPPEVVSQLSNRIEHLRADNQLVHGTILYSDIENYTALSESMPPKVLGQLMSDYYETIFAPVKQYGGIVLNVTGDAMLAIWPTSEQNPALRRQACHTALEIGDALNRFNEDTRHPPLHTRIGIHCGEILLGNFGGGHRFEYTAIGDIANTASRIEGLNKVLKTRLLVSRRVMEGLDGFLTRELGGFLLSGKSNPLVIYELIGYIDDYNIDQSSLYGNFSAGLALYRKQRWQEAVKVFTKGLAEKEEDGPALFYIRQCKNLMETLPSNPWDGVIRIDNK